MMERLIKRINIIIVCVAFLDVITSCKFDSINKVVKDNREKTDIDTMDSDSKSVSNSQDNEVDELTFEFQLQNDSVGRYLSKATDFPIFIYTDSSGNIPYDTAMHKYIDIDGAGCYEDKDERFTFLETPIKFCIYDGIKFISSTNDFNMFVITNKQIGDKEFMLVIDSNGLLKSFIDVKHSVWSMYCNVRRDYKISDNQNDFAVEFRDYVSRKEPDFENEINGILLIDKSGDIVIKYNKNQK